jgi:N-acetylglutamate synthase-like GNAT family acetyltransferase
MIIRPCSGTDISPILNIINDAAEAYEGVIPWDCWKVPYMTMKQLEAQISDGVEFWCYEEQGIIRGVMGAQKKGEVVLIRHAYVRTAYRNAGIGAKLLNHLKDLAKSPLLVGTWAAAEWAIRFYQNHGFRLLSKNESDELLHKYWSISRRQAENSVVLAGRAWLNSNAFVSKANVIQQVGPGQTYT